MSESLHLKNLQQLNSHFPGRWKWELPKGLNCAVIPEELTNEENIDNVKLFIGTF